MEHENSLPEESNDSSRDRIFEPIVISSGSPPPPSPPVSTRPRLLLPIALFILTCFSTLFAGMLSGIPANVENNDELMAAMPEILWSGGQYAGALMAILLAHEMGHYLQSRRYHVPASLPYFIPMPLTPIGTMGAVILQRAGRADRKAMFDIAISGPLAGLVLALPAMAYGLQQSKLTLLPDQGRIMLFGEPLIVKWLIQLQFGPLLPRQEVLLHPVAFAGWVGIFITALNLIPVSQLDGGHILYCLLGKRAHPIASGLWLSAVAAAVLGGLYVDPNCFGWSVMLGLVWLMGVRHPPTANDRVPLGAVRVCLGWATLAFFVIGFTPFPIYEKELQPDPLVHNTHGEVTSAAVTSNDVDL